MDRNAIDRNASNIENDSRIDSFAESVDIWRNNSYYEVGSEIISGYNYSFIYPKLIKSNEKCLIFIHGFPDTMYTFHYQLYHLANLGYPAYSITLRGYNPTTNMPMSSKDLNIVNIAHDYLYFMKQRQCNTWIVTGHDWGAIIGQVMISLNNVQQSAQISSLISLAIPNINKFTWNIFNRHIYVQLLNSWYFLFFQFPFLPEFYLSFGDGIRNFLLSWMLIDEIEHKEHVINYLQISHHVIQAAIQYYRANILKMSFFFRSDVSEVLSHLNDNIDTSIYYISGQRDNCINYRLFIDDKNVTILDEVGHYPHIEHKAYINTFLSRLLMEL